MRFAIAALGCLAGSFALPAFAQDWHDTLKWGDGREVHWKAASAPACYGSNVTLRFANRTQSSGSAQMKGITFKCANGTEAASPDRSVGLVEPGTEADSEVILCACPETGGVTELLSVDLQFTREGGGREALANGCVYSGGYSQGKRNGQGVFTCPTGYRLEGTFRNDEAEGVAKETLPTGQVYEGNFRAGAREGRGVMNYSNGTVYDGEFKNGLRNGTGSLTYPDSSQYVGAWVDDKRIGYGTYTSPDQAWTYSGDWKNDRRVGNGKLVYSDGSYTYEGPFVADLPDGEGTVNFADGSQFKGIFVKGKQSGPGTMTFPNGRKIIGDFEELHPEGKAVDIGLAATYDGEWVNGLLHGHVVMTSTNGNRFDGQFLNGKRNGVGMETFADGAKRECTWVDDIPQQPCNRWTAEGKPIQFRGRR